MKIRMKRRLDMASGLYHSLAAKGITLQVRMQKLLCLILKIWVPMITKIDVHTFALLHLWAFLLSRHLSLKLLVMSL